jgi:NitT/TauT family transport system substrate-binding protein
VGSKSLTYVAPFALAVSLLASACGGTAPAPAPSAPTTSAAAKPSAPASAAAAASTPASAKPAASAPASATAAASAAAAAKPGLTQVRLGLLPSVASAPIYTNLESGAFASSGLDVSITPFTDTVQIMVSIAGGQLEMGQITLGVGALNAMARGTDLKLVASANQDPAEHGALTPLLIRTDLIDSGQVKSVKDLKGRKLAINGKGTILEYTIGKLMLGAGLQPSDVDVVVLPLPDQVTALGNKAIDASLTLQPLATQAVQKGVAKVLTDTVTPNAQLGMIAVNSKWAETHREATVNFLFNHVKMIRRLADGKIKSDSEALAAIQKWVKTEPEVVRAAPDPNWPKDAKLNRASMADEQKYFLDQKATNYSEPIPIDRIADDSYLDEALKKLGS